MPDFVDGARPLERPATGRPDVLGRQRHGDNGYGQGPARVPGRQRGAVDSEPEIRCPLELRVANARAGEFDTAGGVRPGMRICAGTRTALPSRRCDRSTAIFRRASGGSPQTDAKNRPKIDLGRREITGNIALDYILIRAAALTAAALMWFISLRIFYAHDRREAAGASRGVIAGFHCGRGLGGRRASSVQTR